MKPFCKSTSESRAQASNYDSLGCPRTLRWPQRFAIRIVCTEAKMTIQARPQLLIEQRRLLTTRSTSCFENDEWRHGFQTLAKGAAAAGDGPFETMVLFVHGVGVSDRRDGELVRFVDVFVRSRSLLSPRGSRRIEASSFYLSGVRNLRHFRKLHCKQFSTAFVYGRWCRRHGNAARFLPR